ncbi:MAG: hypothetical protein AMJ75_11425 [Phycisphaerae bacterium SM1_79]|nr:MAG: hypothetical protein AMJ75_11425 [Phycisphaerae bacterium SM1_79]
MDRIILGDNQFFGVSHMSEEKGMARAQRFQNISAIIEILDAAYEAGIHGFTFSTHDRVRQLCDHFRANPEKYADLRLYPVLPYAQKYAHLVNEKGIVGAMKQVVIADSTAGQVASMMARGGAAVLKQDPRQIMKLLIDAEMKMFRDLTVEAAFLQNNVADLLLGLGIKEIFTEFATYVEQKYNTRAGFMTLNMPRMVEFLQQCGIDKPIVCFAMNKVGFQMNPDIASYERALQTNSFQAMVMSIMAAGAVPPKEAIEYVTGFKNIKSLVFGASTKAHVKGTKELMDEFVKRIS